MPLKLRSSALALVSLVVFALSLRADDVLFIGNSFTQGVMAPVVAAHGGVPRLFEQIALARGKTVKTYTVATGGKDWAWHLGQPATAQALAARPYDWVVLQDYSTRPTHMGDIAAFMHDGETFSDRIAAASPKAGIVLYETWARPPAFYTKASTFTGPEQMMQELHTSYGNLGDDLAKRDPKRPVRVALIGTAFARCNAEFPAINLNAKDNHHSTAEGYYLAALVIYESIYHESVKGVPEEFYKGALIYPPDVAEHLQDVADEVAGGATAAPAAK